MKRILYILTFILFGLFGVVENGYGDDITWNHTFTSSGSVLITNNTTSLNGKLWSISTTVGKGSPTCTSVVNGYSKPGWAFGSSKDNYYSNVILSTNEFTNYKIKSVILVIRLNGGVLTTITVMQNSMTIGSNNINTLGTWHTLNANTNKGNGGNLSINISTTQAFYINSISVTYISDPTPTIYDTITFRDIHNNKWTQKTTENSDTIFFHDTVPSDACKLNGWIFAGWSTDSLDETKIIKDSSYIIPTKNDTLYAWYVLNTQSTLYVLVENDLDTEWGGDYLIAYSDTKIADGRIGGSSGIDKQESSVNPGEKLNDKKIDKSWGDLYHVTLEEITINSNTYVLKTQDDLYNYHTKNTSNGISTTSNKSTAAAYPITVNFVNKNDVRLSLGGNASGAVFRYNNATIGSGGQRFRFYKNCGQESVYLYKKQAVSDIKKYLTNPQCFGNENTIRVAEWFEDSVKFDIGNYESIYKYDGTLNPFNSCDSIRIKITNDNDEDCIRWFQVPIFAGKTISRNDCNCDVVVLHDSTFTVSNNMANSNVYVYGTLIIDKNKTYTVNSLTLRRDNDSVPQLLYNGTLNTKKLYFELRTDGSDWRWLSLPDTLSAEQLRNPGSEIILGYYDGAIRAANGRNGWQNPADDNIFKPGEGFIFGISKDDKQIYKFELDTNILKQEKNRKYVRIHPYFHKNKPKNDLGWNLVGNPFMTTDTVSTNFGVAFKSDSLILETDINGNWTGRWDTIPGMQKLRYIVVPSWDTEEEIAAGGYKQICLQNGYKLKPFTSFFIQAKQGSDTLYFYQGSRIADIKKMSKNYINDESFLQIQVGSIKTGCYISNKFNDDYEIGDDMESLYSTYLLINGYKLLYSAINDFTINNGIMIYTQSGNLCLDEKTDINDFEEINALYNGNWYDLLHGQTVDVSNSFILQARRKENSDMPTGIINLEYSTDTKKFILNNNVYILRNNEIYNVLGNKVK